MTKPTQQNPAIPDEWRHDRQQARQRERFSKPGPTPAALRRAHQRRRGG